MTYHLTFALNPLPAGRPRRCRGTSGFDLLVALGLLVTVMSVATPLVVRHGRLLTSHRNYRLALDELSNQLDRLRAMPVNELPDEMERLTPSGFVKERLPGAKLDGKLRPEESGTHITLRLSWNDAERHRAPMTVAAWIFPTTLRGASAPTEADVP
jgi:hypothetical protein